MKKSYIAIVLILCNLGVALAAKEGKKESPHKIVGTWKLISSTVQYPDGRVLPDPNFGPSAKGYLFYDSSGHMCVPLMNPNRFDWRNPQAPALRDVESAMNGYGGFCGSYEVHESEAVIVHHKEVALVPNEVGTSLERHFAIAGDRLNLVTEGIHNGQRLSFTLTWERVN